MNLQNPDDGPSAALRAVGKAAMTGLAVIGGVVATVQAWMWLADAPGTLFVVLAIALIVIAPLAYLLWLVFRRDAHSISGFLGVAFAVGLGSIIIGISPNGSDSGTDSSSDSDATQRSQQADVIEFTAQAACEALPKERSDPPLRRECIQIALNDTAIDLDSTDAGWGSEIAPQDGADIEYRGFFSAIDPGNENLAVLEGSDTRYAACRANASWEYLLAEEDAIYEMTAPAICVRTDRGRYAMLFISELPGPNRSGRAVVYASVWDRDAG